MPIENNALLTSDFYPEIQVPESYNINGVLVDINNDGRQVLRLTLTTTQGDTVYDVPLDHLVAPTIYTPNYDDLIPIPDYYDPDFFDYRLNQLPVGELNLIHSFIPDIETDNDEDVAFQNVKPISKLFGFRKD